MLFGVEETMVGNKPIGMPIEICHFIASSHIPRGLAQRISRHGEGGGTVAVGNCRRT